MALKLPRKPRNVAVVDGKGFPTQNDQLWWQSAVSAIETAFTSLEATVTAIAAAQAAAAAAQSAADAAQAAADAAQATADSITVPPTSSRTVTANTTALTSDGTILCNASSGNITVTLFNALLAENVLTIKKIDSSSNTVTIDPAGSQLINGSSTLTLTTQYETALCVSDGSSEWFA